MHHASQSTYQFPSPWFSSSKLQLFWVIWIVDDVVYLWFTGIYFCDEINKTDQTLKLFWVDAGVLTLLYQDLTNSVCHIASRSNSYSSDRLLSLTVWVIMSPFASGTRLSGRFIYWCFNVCWVVMFKKKKPINWFLWQICGSLELLSWHLWNISVWHCYADEKKRSFSYLILLFDQLINYWRLCD